MDAANPSARPHMAVRAPLHIGCYALAVRDLGRVADFYRAAVGLDLMELTASRALLGAGGVPLLHLEHRADLKPDDKAAAGLFHAAFAMPTRGDLARWYRHAQRIGLAIARTGDHLVNEAIYFDDPEGNGCECYADRPPETWAWDAAGHCTIETGRPVDLQALARAAEGAEAPWRAPAGLRIGHINLRVGDCAAAERFYAGVIGLDFTGRRHIEFAGRPNTISFMSSGRYHHHLAANDFTSRGAGLRDPDRAGLSWFAFAHSRAIDGEAIKARLAAAGAAVAAIDGGFETRDPWGTRVRFVAA